MSGEAASASASGGAKQPKPPAKFALNPDYGAKENIVRRPPPKAAKVDPRTEIAMAQLAKRTVQTTA